MADDKVGALKLAAAEGKIDEIKRLVEQANISVDQPDEYGDTALHAACQNGRNEIVKYLLAKGANPNVRNKVGSTPLHKLVASKYEQKNILKQLLKANADPTIRNGAGKLPEEFVKNKGILLELLGELAVQDEINIPKEKHGRVIGKGGQKMTEIRDETHCHITVPDHSDSSTAISVIGRQEGVTRAKELIKEAVAERKLEEEEEADGLTTVRYPLPKDQHKLVIGQGGRTINKIRDDTNVQIVVPKVGDPDTAILLKGEPDNITKAIQAINFVTRPRPVGEGRGGFGGGRGGYNDTDRRNSDGNRRGGQGQGQGQGQGDRRGSNDKIAIDFNIADNRGRNAPRGGGRGGGAGGPSRGSNGNGGASSSTEGVKE